MANGPETVDHKAREGIVSLNEQMHSANRRHDEMAARFDGHTQTMHGKLEQLDKRSIERYAMEKARDAREEERAKLEDKRVRDYADDRNKSDNRQDRRTKTMAMCISAAIGVMGLALGGLQIWIKSG